MVSLRNICLTFGLTLCLCTISSAQKATNQFNGNSGSKNSAQVASKKTATSNSIELLLEEISQLKFELVPESAQQHSKRATSTTQLPVSVTTTPPSEEIKITAQQQTTVVATTSSSTTTPPTQSVKARSLGQTPTSSASDKSVCDKSLAVGTLGYRMLCRNHVPRVKLTAEVTPTEVSSSSSSLPESDLNWRPDPVNLDSAELRALRNLLDRLIKRGNYRSLSTGEVIPTSG